MEDLSINKIIANEADRIYLDSIKDALEKIEKTEYRSIFDSKESADKFVKLVYKKSNFMTQYIEEELERLIKEELITRVKNTNILVGNVKSSAILQNELSEIFRIIIKGALEEFTANELSKSDNSPNSPKETVSNTSEEIKSEDESIGSEERDAGPIRYATFYEIKDLFEEIVHREVDRIVFDNYGSTFFNLEIKKLKFESYGEYRSYLNEFLSNFYLSESYKNFIEKSVNYIKETFGIRKIMTSRGKERAIKLLSDLLSDKKDELALKGKPVKNLTCNVDILLEGCLRIFILKGIF